MSAIFYWIVDRLIDFLANLNPERAAKVEQIRLEAVRLDGLFKQAEEDKRQSEAQYAASLLERQLLQAQIAENWRLFTLDEKKLEESETRRRQIRDEAIKREKEIDSRTTDDLIMGGVPKPRP